MKFDQLHKLEADYFEPMAIGADDKKRRRELAELLLDALLYFFAVYEVHSSHNGTLEKALYEQLLADRISDAVSQTTGIDAEISNHIRTLAIEVVDTTFKNAKKNDESEQERENKNADEDIDSILEYEESLAPSSPPTSDSYPQELDEFESELVKESEEDDRWLANEEKDEPDYWLSYRRALNIAYSEANTFFNYTDYVEAKDLGRTKKTWLTMLDDKVRDTHEEIEGVTIGIDELFQVGNSQMKFPHDWTTNPDPKEVINCRCAVEYK